MSAKDKKSMPFSDTSSEPAMSKTKGHGDKPRKKIKENWRINLLAQAKSPREKYKKPDEVFNSGVNPGALTVEITDRNDHIARPALRTLVMNKRQFSSLPTTFPDYESRMDKSITNTWNSIYNYYKKAKKEIAIKRSQALALAAAKKASKAAKKKKKGAKEKGEKKGKGKKKGKKDSKSKSSVRTDEDIELERQEWCALRAQPKRIHHPPPIQRGPIADLDDIKDRMEELAVPKYPTKKFLEMPVIDPHKIKKEVLTYQASDRVKVLAKPAAFRMVKEIPLRPGAVQPDALLAIPSPRVLELSVPRAKQNAGDADLKENPFSISPNALKYTASPRILELAKPIDRK